MVINCLFERTVGGGGGVKLRIACCCFVYSDDSIPMMLCNYGTISISLASKSYDEI